MIVLHGRLNVFLSIIHHQCKSLSWLVDAKYTFEQAKVGTSVRLNHSRTEKVATNDSKLIKSTPVCIFLSTIQSITNIGLFLNSGTNKKIHKWGIRANKVGDWPSTWKYQSGNITGEWESSTICSIRAIVLETLVVNNNLLLFYRLPVTWKRVVRNAGKRWTRKVYHGR